MLKILAAFAKKQMVDREKICHRCGKLMKLNYQSDPFLYRTVDEETEILVHNLPMYECKSCNLKIGDLILYADIKEIIDRAIFYRREKIPKEIEFPQINIKNDEDEDDQISANMTLAEKLAKRIENKPPMSAKEALDKLVEDGLIAVTDEPRITGMFGEQRNIYGKSKE